MYCMRVVHRGSGLVNETGGGGGGGGGGPGLILIGGMVHFKWKTAPKTLDCEAALFSTMRHLYSTLPQEIIELLQDPPSYPAFCVC